MAFYIQNIRQAQVCTKPCGQPFLSLQTLPACQRWLKSTKPSFIQKFHHLAGNNLRSEAQLNGMKPSFWNKRLEQSGCICVPTASKFHHLATSLSSRAHTKTTKPSLHWNSLELGGRKRVPSISNFHYLAENTLNSNAAYFMRLGEFVWKSTETNIATLERMGIKVHHVDSLRATDKLKVARSDLWHPKR